jgi:hypothetical protein
MVNPLDPRSAPKIRFTIDRCGQIEMNISGIKGNACDALVKVFEPLGKIHKNQTKLEYYESSPQSQSQSLSQSPSFLPRDNTSSKH